MRPHTRAVRVLSSVLILIGVGAASCAPGPAGLRNPGTSAVAPKKAQVRTVTEYTVGQFNMAGGNAEHGPKGDEAPDAFVRDVRERGSAFVTLQEACRDWNERMLSRLPGYGVAFHPVRSADGTPGRCKHPSDFGNAVLFREDLGFDAATAIAYPLESPAGYEQREMLCVRSDRRRTVVCSAHLSYGDKGTRPAVRRHEAQVAARILATEYAGYTRFFGGDLNDDPLSEATGNFYEPRYRGGAHGEFQEAGSPCGDDIEAGYPTESPASPESTPVWVRCRSAVPTHGQGKIDYLFVEPRLRVLWSETTEAVHSDHDPLWARVRF
ncbi:endonuclease/exonuclease/phosphatase family protein [Streptomyces cavernae]|uniref:endonuclease/exonuclease/phosphatase family protein n=1 Tax=Streptomyces cavernae TaxID=2259034 RepID=UPI000FEBFFFB|nr:endonuclease/exonuclease/phosphatase family protein [Streptomyces cavernae]